VLHSGKIQTYPQKLD